MNRVQELCRELADELEPVISHVAGMAWDGHALSRHRMFENAAALESFLRRLRSGCEELAGDGDVFDRIAMYAPIHKVARIEVELFKHRTTTTQNDSLVHVPNPKSEASHAEERCK